MINSNKNLYTINIEGRTCDAPKNFPTPDLNCTIKKVNLISKGSLTYIYCSENK